MCAACGGSPQDPRLRRPARGLPAQLTAGASAPFVGLGALLTLRGVKRWILPPTVGAAVLITGALVWLWTALDAAIGADRAVDLDLPGWLAWAEGALEWFLDIEWLRAGGVLAFVLVAAVVWWFGYAIVFEVLAGPFLSRMQARAEQHWLGGRAEIDEHPFEVRGLLLLVGSAGLGALLAWWLPGWWALAGLAAPTLLAWAALPPFRAWLGPFVATEGRAGVQGLVVAAVALVGALVFLPLHLVPLVGSYAAATAAGFFLALGTLDLSLERRGWSLDGRLALARRSIPALAAFGAVSGALFGVPVLGPLVMLPGASLGGAWLVCKLDKTALVGPPPVPRR